jgi:hypothetical protein
VNNAEDSGSRHKLRRYALVLSALAIVGMGSVTACSPRHEKPAEPSVTTPSTGPSGTPTEKNVRTNVTRTPMSAVPPGAGNPAVPCGFGPAGGGPCTRNRN